MKANELMISNVMSGGKIITALDQEQAWLFTEGVVYPIKYKDLIPEKLTEEWLIKLNIPYMTWFYNGRFCIVRYDNVGYVLKVNNDSCTESIEIKIEYVHQLQNLYFALTNEELEINE